MVLSGPCGQRFERTVKRVYADDRKTRQKYATQAHKLEIEKQPISRATPAIVRGNKRGIRLFSPEE